MKLKYIGSKDLMTLTKPVPASQESVRSVKSVIELTQESPYFELSGKEGASLLKQDSVNFEMVKEDVVGAETSKGNLETSHA